MMVPILFESLISHCSLFTVCSLFIVHGISEDIPRCCIKKAETLAHTNLQKALFEQYYIQFSSSFSTQQITFPMVGYIIVIKSCWGFSLIQGTKTLFKKSCKISTVQINYFHIIVGLWKSQSKILFFFF